MAGMCCSIIILQAWILKLLSLSPGSEIQCIQPPWYFSPVSYVWGCPWVHFKSLHCPETKSDFFLLAWNGPWHFKIIKCNLFQMLTKGHKDYGTAPVMLHHHSSDPL